MNKLILIFLIINLLKSDYEMIQNDKYNIIYPKNYTDIAHKYKELMNLYIPYYNDIYGYKLRYKINLTIHKKTKQISNAKALFNNIHSFAGGYGGARHDLYASISWSYGIMTHELSHSYQMLSHLYPQKRSFLGKSIIAFPYIPLILEPNMFLPSSFLEGNAVLMESLIGYNGGRLYSGYTKSLLYSKANHNLSLSTLLNNTRKTHNGDIKYSISGYFMKFLYDKYGLKKTNSIFLNHSDKYWNVYNFGFKSIFGKTLDELFYEFVMELKNNSFTKSKGKVIQTSTNNIDLNKQNNKIYFISTSLHKNNKINTFNINTKKLSNKDTTFEPSKIFKIKNKLYSSSSSYINDDVFYALIDEKGLILKNTKSKLFTLIQNKNHYYFDTINSFGRLRLYKNDDFLYEIDSYNIALDYDDLYYFKNEKNKRFLFKNNKKVFSFLGYYSFVVDYDDEFVYFIASSKYGSSLFGWHKKEKKTYQILDGDDIYNAKKIDNNKFLISSINAKNHQVMKVKTNIREKKVHNMSFDIIINKKIKNDKKEKPIAYEPFFNMTINSISFISSINDNNNFYQATINMKDKSEHIKAEIGLNGYEVSLRYANTYYDNFNHKIDVNIKNKTISNFNFMYLKTLYKNNQESINLNSGYEYSNTRFNQQSIFTSISHEKTTKNTESSFKSSGYESKIYTKYILNDGINTKISYLKYSKLSNNTFLNFYNHFAFSSSKTHTNKINLKKNHYPFKDENIDTNSNIYGYIDWMNKTSIEMIYEHNINYYTTLPISIIKSDFKIKVSNYQVDDNRFNELLLTANTKFLLGYNLESDISFNVSYNDYIDEVKSGRFFMVLSIWDKEK